MGDIASLDPMISSEHIRILEPRLKNAPDAVVSEIRERLYECARMGIDTYLEEYGSNFPLGSSDEMNDESV